MSEADIVIIDEVMTDDSVVEDKEEIEEIMTLESDDEHRNQGQLIPTHLNTETELDFLMEYLKYVEPRTDFTASLLDWAIR